ncbi:MAG: Rrf2 family transcriptional regulator [Oscillospiraceae bacterium]|nr:Rrf2 family transcriptional regulator [Oscillospiraceae bacterium]
MQFSSRFTIAVHILVCTAMFQEREKVTSAFLAGSIGVNPVIVRNVLGQLSAAGLVEIRAGVGGAHLARPAEEITLLDLFRAVEKDKALFHFHENPNPLCPVGRNIHTVMDSRLTDIQSAMERQMAETTLRQLVDETQEKA